MLKKYIEAFLEIFRGEKKIISVITERDGNSRSILWFRVVAEVFKWIGSNNLR